MFIESWWETYVEKVEESLEEQVAHFALNLHLINYLWETSKLLFSYPFYSLVPRAPAVLAFVLKIHV